MIVIENLSFAYRKKPVFDQLNLEFTAGHVYGLLGKNGTGKSSLLRNIAGLLAPKKGNTICDPTSGSGSLLIQ
jgi:ABC-2 type transport system ATP-binding protein